MQNTSRASSTSRVTRRAVIWASALSSSVLLVSAGGCSGEDIGPGTPGVVSGSGPSAGTLPGLSGAASTSGGASSTSGSGAGAATPGGALGTGGSGFGGDVTGSGGAIVGAGGTGGGSKLCVDVEPPPDPNWPEANCKRWAAETKECGAAWFAQYCDASCGRCVPQSGGTGGSGTASGGKSTGGSTSSGGAPSAGKSAGGSTASGGTASAGKSAGGGNAVAGAAGSGTAGAASVNCASAGLPNVTGGEGFATRYWDCCQPHCSQFNGHRCAQDGVTSTGNTTSACNGGGSFACYDEAPRAVSDCLSYGHIAKANPNCGGCYRIQFTGQGQHNASDPGSVLIKGKQMIVKVTNTGGDVANGQFDLMIPGGGVGLFNACSRQWGTSDLGAQYGGFLTECSGSHAEKKECVRRECMKIPAGPARNGCLWFVDWLQVADNPKFTSQATSCPF